jgi:hypothetical protein
LQWGEWEVLSELEDVVEEDGVEEDGVEEDEEEDVGEVEEEGLLESCRHNN